MHGDSPFVVRGVVYGNAPIGAPGLAVMGASNCLYARDFPLIAGLGANTIWTRERVSPADRVFRRSLESAGLYWIAGFSLAPYVTAEGSLADAGVRARILDDVSAYVAGWADEPRLLAASFGDDAGREYALAFGGDPRDFYTLLQEAAERLHAERPGLLVTTSVSDAREIGDIERATQDAMQPELDFWSLDLGGARRAGAQSRGSQRADREAGAAVGVWPRCL